MKTRVPRPPQDVAAIHEGLVRPLPLWPFGSAERAPWPLTTPSEPGEVVHRVRMTGEPRWRGEIEVTVVDEG